MTIVGIDLGTTHSLVAVLHRGEPVLIPNGIGELLTPSAVSVDGDETLVGAPALARQTTHPETCASSFKRDMGTSRKTKLGRRDMLPQELSALVLASLKRDAEAFLGETITEAVVTVPAYFGDAQRQATRDAGAIAGLKVERIINEPTAAALAYGLHQRDREFRAVVLDLGGGTFDVTVLEVIEGIIEIQGSAGDSQLGGNDFTDALYSAVVERLGEGPLDGLARARVWQACDDAKRKLSERDGARVVAPSLEVGDRRIDLDQEWSRSDVEALWTPLLQRIQAPIQRALRDASALPDAIDEVLLVGGATRMGVIQQLATRVFGKLPRRDLPTDEVVALGAAVQAGLKAGDEAVDDLVVTDIAPFTMGIASASKMGQRVVDGLFSPILERGTVIPASRVERFFTMEHNQTEILVTIFQGEHSLCRDNQKLGQLRVKGLPRAPAGESCIDVRFTYDLNGLLEVEVEVVGTERKEHLVIEKSPGRLSQREVAKARREMERIKFHPRDSLPNRTALARADALYEELTGVERESLGAALAAFRTALESQEPELIEMTREQLVHLTGALRRS